VRLSFQTGKERGAARAPPVKYKKERSVLRKRTFLEKATSRGSGTAEKRGKQQGNHLFPEKREPKQRALVKRRIP